MNSGYVIDNLRLWILCMMVINFNWKNKFLLSLASYIKKEKKSTEELESKISRKDLHDSYLKGKLNINKLCVPNFSNQRKSNFRNSALFKSQGPPE